MLRSPGRHSATLDIISESTNSKQSRECPQTLDLFYLLLFRYFLFSFYIPVETIALKSVKHQQLYLLLIPLKKKWSQWFLNDSYTVSKLHEYTPEAASNLFLTCSQLPQNARYRLMLEEAQYTIAGYIKGRGNIALNVINDHFWVAFVKPELENNKITSEFLAKNIDKLQMPAAESSTANPFDWLFFAKNEKQAIAILSPTMRTQTYLTYLMRKTADDPKKIPLSWLMVLPLPIRTHFFA